MADTVPEVAHLAFYLADGCAKILVPLLRFLGRPSPRSPAVDLAVAVLLLVLPTAYVAAVVLAYFVGLIFRYINLVAPVPAPASATALCFACLGRFVVLLFTLVSTWRVLNVLIAVPLAALSLLFGAGKCGIVSGFSWNVLS